MEKKFRIYKRLSSRDSKTSRGFDGFCLFKMLLKSKTHHYLPTKLLLFCRKNKKNNK